MREPLQVILLMVLFPLVATSALAANGMDEEMQEIVKAQAEIKSMETAFVQTRTLSLFDETMDSRGTIIIEKPDFYYWLYQEPEGIVFYVDGTSTGSYDPESGERDETALDSRMGLNAIIRSITAIITGNLESTTYSDFKVSRNPDAVALVSYTFLPRDEALQSLFEQVTIHFDKRTKLARELEIVEPNGDTTFMKFDGWRTNITVDRHTLLN